MKASWRKLWWGAAVLYLAALLIRIAGLNLAEIQADERLWVQRSNKVLNLLSSDPQSATTALGQPGVTPALLMAGGQYAARKLNAWRGAQPGDRAYIFQLDASRLAVAVVSALVAPLLYVAAASWWGAAPAFLAGAFIALDPRHIGFSRMAHLDAVLTLLVVLTLVFYCHGVRGGKLRWKLLAGLCWGLAVATKPTAGLLLVAFMLYKALRRWQVKQGGDRSLLAWGDFAAFLIGHAALALVYTRLWVHASEYRGRLRIRSPLARWFWQNGQWLQENPLILSMLCGGLLLILLILVRRYRRGGSRWAYYGVQLSAFSAVLTLLLAAFPQVFENFARFWKWAFTLVGEEHQAYGITVAPMAQGYLWFFLSQTPTLVLLGLAGAVVFLAHDLLRRRRSEELAMALFLVLTVLIWVLPLSLSAKQTWRYALPIVPLLSALAAYGW